MRELNAGDVRSRSEFIDFVHHLLRDLKDHPDRYENRDVYSYLEALAAWTEDMDGYFEGRGEQAPDTPSWSLLAQILQAASIYE